MAFSQGQVAVGSTPTFIATLQRIASSVPVTNTGAVTAYLGGPQVAATGAAQGLPIAAGATINVPASLSEDNDLWAVTGSGSTALNYLLPGSQV